MSSSIIRSTSVFVYGYGESDKNSLVNHCKKQSLVTESIFEGGKKKNTKHVNYPTSTRYTMPAW